MSSYQQHTLEGASPVELVVALYDGILRFLYAAIAATQAGDVTARRTAVRRALDILIHLQARLRMDIGGRPAEVLSEFYASIFALTLQASQTASVERFQEVIRCVRNVRDAWKQVAQQNPLPVAPPPVVARAASVPQPVAPSADSARWTA